MGCCKAGGALAIRCLVEVVGMAAAWYEQRGAGVVSARRCEAVGVGCKVYLFRPLVHHA